MPKQGTLPLVGETPKQGGEVQSQKWDWVEVEVWTGRMLTTLENGVKGGLSTLANAYFIEHGAVYHDHSPCSDLSVPLWTPLTGEPDAGDLHVRFGGGRGRELTVPSYPYPSVREPRSRNSMEISRGTAVNSKWPGEQALS